LAHAKVLAHHILAATAKTPAAPQYQQTFNDTIHQKYQFETCFDSSICQNFGSNYKDSAVGRVIASGAICCFCLEESFIEDGNSNDDDDTRHHVINLKCVDLESCLQDIVYIVQNVSRSQRFSVH
jgi:hypothetical protein